VQAEDHTNSPIRNIDAVRFTVHLQSSEGAP